MTIERFLSTHAETVEKFFAFAEAGGYPVARELLYMLRRRAVGKFRAEPGQEKSRLHFGMGWVGDPEAVYTRREGVLILHWPTLLRKLPEFIEEGNPEITAFVWQFSEIIRSKSLVLYDFLKRQIELNLSKFTMEQPKALPLSPEEIKTFKSAVGLLTHKKMVDAFRESFRVTWGERVDDRLSARKWAVCFTSAKPGEVSLFETEDIMSHEERCKTVTPFIIDPEGMVFPKVMSPWVYELAYAFGLRSPELGVIECKNPIRKKLPDCLIINLELFTAYRHSVSPLLQDFLSCSPMDVRISFENNCPGVWYESGPPTFREIVERTWPNYNVDNILYIDVPKFISRIERITKMERIRQFRKFPPEPPVRRVHVLELTSPACPELENATFKVQLIRRGNYNYLCPSWPIAFKAQQGDPETLYVADKGVFFFRYSRLFRLDPNIFNSSSTLREWMEYLGALSLDDYKKLCHADTRKKRAYSDDKRLPNFTEEQISAITRMVRPRMTEDDKKYLQDFCDGRSWKKIMLKAKEIRIAMIKKGIRDVTKVPHLNYNARLKKELKDATITAIVPYVRSGEVGDVETIV